MWTLALPVVLVGVCTQVATCHSPCSISGLEAKCSSRRLSRVPALPPNITHLYLESNHISHIDSTSLEHLPELLYLNLLGQLVPLVIGNGSFLRQTKLISLVLGDNEGLTLEPGAFSGLLSLRQLHLYHCGFTESVLAQSYLQPLSSLKLLDLSGNKLVRLRPGLFFENLIQLTELNLKLNRIERLCEEDLLGFRGKYFTSVNLDSNRLFKMATIDFDWARCGNPFRGMGFGELDLSTNGFNVTALRLFLNAIDGTPIDTFVFSGYLGKGFSHNNFADPDGSTFQGLTNSGVRVLDLSGNRIFALQRAVFGPLRSALIIDVSQNKINQIERDAFRGLQGHLRMLNLSSNLLGEVYSHTFASLTDLRVLDLSYNHIGALGYEAFDGLPNLKALYLTGNSLRNLGFPASLPNLLYLYLGDNRLTSLYKVADLGMNSIHVDVEANKLTNLEDVYHLLMNFKHLQNLFFGGNFIKWCTLGTNVSVPVNNSLQVLDLHDSSLQLVWAQETCLDIFDHLENLLGLNLSFNALEALPQGIFSGLLSVIEIDLSSNALTYLRSDVFPGSLKRLDLSNNFLASPDPATFQSLLFLSLSSNRFFCDCHLESFLTWLNGTNVTFLSPLNEYKCEFPATFQNLPLLEYATIVEPCEEDDEKAVRHLKFILFIFSTLLIFTVTLSGLLYARFRGQLFVIYKKVVSRVLEGPKAQTPEEGEEDVQYDAYICFSHSDYRWVEAALLKKLDNKFSEDNILRCCFEARDFLPGVDHLSNIRDAIWGSRKTLCIISKEFLKDGWCLEAFTLAQSRMLDELTNVLVMLVVGKVANYQLMKYNAIRGFVQKRQYLTWPEDPQDLGWFYERLVAQILRDSKLKKTAEEKPDNPAQEEDGVQLENIRPLT